MTEPVRDDQLNPDIEQKFKEDFGREMTPDERRLLKWTERVVRSQPTRDKAS